MGSMTTDLTYPIIGNRETASHGCPEMARHKPLYAGFLGRFGQGNLVLERQRGDAADYDVLLTQYIDQDFLWAVEIGGNDMNALTLERFQNWVVER